ncbi:MAG: zinc ribbon domain-containing protein [Lautropia sp.]|nr:zinc ribbon domain-containing protein [Lautropia sp.]
MGRERQSVHAKEDSLFAEGEALFGRGGPRHGLPVREAVSGEGVSSTPDGKLGTDSERVRASSAAHQPRRDDASPADALAEANRPCPECGASLAWSAAKQALACPYCGTVVPWPVAAEGDESGREAAGTGEQDLEAALRDPANVRDWGHDRREVKCQSCHAISVFVDGKVASRCDFCGSPAIVPHEQLQDAIVPQSVLPFRISQEQVRDLIKKWYGSRWFAPNKLKSAALTDSLHGVYLPYWTFDAKTHAVWRAEAGHHYYENQQVRGPDGKLQWQQVQKVRWVPASGQVQHFFDDELVPGTVGVQAPLLRRVEPFPTTTDLKPYSSEYVRGWTVERYQIDLRQASQIGQQQMADKLRALCAARVPGDTQRNLVVQATWQGRTFKHVLVPVWLVHYRFGSKLYQLVVNGYTGQVAGEQPYSWIKIALAVLGLLLLFAAMAYSQR